MSESVRLARVKRLRNWGIGADEPFPEPPYAEFLDKHDQMPCAGGCGTIMRPYRKNGKTCEPCLSKKPKKRAARKRTKKKITCFECGEEFEGMRKNARCPPCAKDRRRKYFECRYDREKAAGGANQKPETSKPRRRKSRSSFPRAKKEVACVICGCKYMGHRRYAKCPPCKKFYRRMYLNSYNNTTRQVRTAERAT